MPQPEASTTASLPDCQPTDQPAAAGTRTLHSALGERQLSLFYLSWLTFAEMAVSYGQPLLGLVLQGLLLLALLLHAGLYSHGARQKFLAALALAPLIRLLSLMLPVAVLPPPYAYAAAGLPLFLAACLAMRFCQLSPSQAGLILRRPGWQVPVALSGVIFGYIEYRILQPGTLQLPPGLPYPWAPTLLLLLFTGFLEEFVFRGVMQPSALQFLGRYGLLYVALVFTMMHTGYRSLPNLAFVLLVGLFYAWVVRRTSSLLGVSLSHGLVNIAVFLFFPLLLAKPSLPAPLPTPVEVSPTFLPITAAPAIVRTSGPSSSPTLQSVSSTPPGSAHPATRTSWVPAASPTGTASPSPSPTPSCTIASPVLPPSRSATPRPQPAKLRPPRFRPPLNTTSLPPTRPASPPEATILPPTRPSAP